MRMTTKMALVVMTLSILMPWGLVGTQAAGATNQMIYTDLQRLQGSWEGVLVGEEKAGKISITITGNSLHFQGLNPTEWYETTFTLPVGTVPPQLHATIKDCAEPCDDAGKVVFAIFKVEDGTLTLAGIQGSSVKPPQTFGGSFENNSLFRYDLKKVQSPNKVTPPPGSR